MDSQTHLGRFFADFAKLLPAPAVEALRAIVNAAVENTHSLAFDAELHRILQPSLETERVFEVDFWTWLRELRDQLPGRRVLDFGCGTGRSQPRVEALDLEWTGLDIASSREAKQRTERTKVVEYDGSIIPLDDASFDAVISIQSLEHVQDMAVTFAELSRIIKPRGFLMGSTSQMEPYHSRSTFSYTAYGFKLLCERHGFTLHRIHPGIDSLTLLTRKLVMLFGRTEAAKPFNRWFIDSSPLNAALVAVGQQLGLKPSELASLRLQYCGTFHFAAKRR